MKPVRAIIPRLRETGSAARAEIAAFLSWWLHELRDCAEAVLARVTPGLGKTGRREVRERQGSALCARWRGAPAARACDRRSAHCTCCGRAALAGCADPRNHSARCGRARPGSRHRAVSGEEAAAGGTRTRVSAFADREAGSRAPPDCRAHRCRASGPCGASARSCDRLWLAARAGSRGVTRRRTHREPFARGGRARISYG